MPSPPSRPPVAVAAPSRRPARATAGARAPRSGRHIPLAASDDNATGERDPAGARLDRRRAHVLDRAAAYVALAEQGLTAAEIARRRRKSPAHVSILLRLGRALAGVPDDERAALRHPRVTWRLVQRLVRADTDPASLRRQLRAAVGGFSTHTVDGRRRGAARAPAPPSAAAPEGATSGVAWGWDAAWFARDPEEYAAAHRAHLAHLHRVVAGRAAAAVRARQAAAVADRADAGQSLRGLQQSLHRRLAQLTPDAAGGAGPAAAERRALAAFAALGDALARVPGAGTPAPRLRSTATTDERDELPDGLAPDGPAADLDAP